MRLRAALFTLGVTATGCSLACSADDGGGIAAALLLLAALLLRRAGS